MRFRLLRRAPAAMGQWAACGGADGSNNKHWPSGCHSAALSLSLFLPHVPGSCAEIPKPLSKKRSRLPWWKLECPPKSNLRELPPSRRWRWRGARTRRAAAQTYFLSSKLWFVSSRMGSKPPHEGTRSLHSIWQAEAVAVAVRVAKHSMGNKGIAQSGMTRTITSRTVLRVVQMVPGQRLPTGTGGSARRERSLVPRQVFPAPALSPAGTRACVAV